MNWDRIEGNWQQVRGKLKQKWGRLTDDQIEVINGQRDILAGKLRETYGIGKDEVERQIREWETTLDEEPARSRPRDDS